MLAALLGITAEAGSACGPYGCHRSNFRNSVPTVPTAHSAQSTPTSLLDSIEGNTLACAQFGYPDGPYYLDVVLDYVHVQDFNKRLIDFETRNIWMDHLREFQTRLNSQFHMAALNNFVRAQDKNLNSGPMVCNDEMTPASGPFEHSFDNDVHQMHPSSDYVSLYAQSAFRSDLFSAALDHYNVWAGEGPNPPRKFNEGSNAVSDRTVVRVLSLGTDDCLREAGLWMAVPPNKQVEFLEDRGLTFPLTGSPLKSCQDRDYPTIEEMASEAARNDVYQVFMVNADNMQDKCLDHQYYEDDTRYPASTQFTIAQWYDNLETTYRNAGAYALTTKTMMAEGLDYEDSVGPATNVMRDYADVLFNDIVKDLCTK